MFLNKNGTHDKLINFDKVSDVTIPDKITYDSILFHGIIGA